ncbi:unnamed protein product [Symbiodinium necroappetens]|uniref:Uncharacterized protein n=1 Tax=Symbiodinium necroappetens TaxID=1628268 RepID=A0A812KY74_9DINO|nr:unnamed protein product [Symbiodinium necroappetens]
MVADDLRSESTKTTPGLKLEDVQLPGACPDDAPVAKSQGGAGGVGVGDVEAAKEAPLARDRSFGLRQFKQKWSRSVSALPPRSGGAQQFGKSINNMQLFSIAPNTVTPLKQLKSQMSDIEGQLFRYLQDRCLDGKSTLRRLSETVVIITAFMVLIPLFTFLLYTVLPMASPKEGFWGNWSFNFLAHPLLNYVIARGQIEMIARIFSIQERTRIRWIVCLVPLADPPLCLLAHLILSFAGVYPIPVAPVLSCIPACLGTLVIFLRMLPKDLLTPETLQFVKFTCLNWIFWMGEFVALILWVAKFPSMPEHWQALSTGGMSILVALTGSLTQKLADRMGCPRYVTNEVKLAAFFLSLLTSASLMSAAKSIGVVLLIAALDAGKALAMTAKLIWELVQALEEEDGIYDYGGELDPEDIAISETTKEEVPKRCWMIFAAKEVLTRKFQITKQVGQRLKAVLRRAEAQSFAEMRKTEISVADVVLLKKLTHSLSCLATMELCEVCIPLLYMMLASLLHSGAFTGNRDFFLHFRFESRSEYFDGMVGNSIAVAIEATVLAVLQVLLLRLLGFSLPLRAWSHIETVSDFGFRVAAHQGLYTAVNLKFFID